MSLPLSDKPRTRAKYSLHTDWVIIWLRRRAGPKELFAAKEIRTSDLIEIPPRPRLLPLEPTQGIVLLELIYNSIGIALRQHSIIPKYIFF